MGEGEPPDLPRGEGAGRKLPGDQRSVAALKEHSGMEDAGSFSVPFPVFGTGKGMRKPPAAGNAPVFRILAVGFCLSLRAKNLFSGFLP